MPESQIFYLANMSFNQGGQRTSQSRDFSDIVHIRLLTRAFTSGKKIDSYAEHTLHSLKR